LLLVLALSCITPGSSAGTAVRSGGDENAGYGVLLFSKTAGFRHDAIPDAIAAIASLGAQHGFAVDATEDASVFDDTTLSQYRAVVFLMTTGDVLDSGQQAAFERYIQAGNGFVGIHSASDTEYNWPWYGRLVGAYFSDHPAIQTATIHVEDHSHPSTAALPETWVRTDEWYNFRSNPRAEVNVLGRLDEATYVGGAMGDDHPIAWYHPYDGGRAWYTAGGHTRESYAESLFVEHLLGGIQFAAGVAASAAPH
jgi:cytochrome c